ncbi:LysR family transcriptional regulator [Luteococcus sp.]|uniref:LysR family transcriptional regulator n=1 Tax=Luteococcus sp. TaxID=1969402 RepID=UPI00373516A6
MDLLRHLEYFLAIVDEGSFSRAAQRLQMAQPPLSQRIKSLEAQLGCELFDRSRRQIELTPAGNLLVPEARMMLQLAADLPHILTTHAGQRPVARVDLPDTWPIWLVAELTADLSQRLDRRVVPRQLPARERCGQTLDQHLVVAPGRGSYEVSTALGLALHPGHALAAAGVIPHPSDFADGQVLLLAEDDWQQDSLASLLVSQGVPATAVHAGVEHSTAVVQVALEDACLVTDRVDAEANQLLWHPLPGALRVWHVVGEHAEQLATAAQTKVGARHG